METDTGDLKGTFAEICGDFQSLMVFVYIVAANRSNDENLLFKR